MPSANFTRLLKAEVTGNVTDQEMTDSGGSVTAAHGVPMSIRVALGTATSIDVTVKDATTGATLLNETSITSSTDYSVDDLLVNAVHGKVTVTTANISDPSHTATVYLSVRE